MDKRTQELKAQVAAGNRDQAPALMAALMRTDAPVEELIDAARFLTEEGMRQFMGATQVGVVVAQERARRFEQERIGEGRKVRYTKGKSGRARAKFVETRDIVPKGLEGVITSMDGVQDHRSQFGTWSNGTSQRVRVELEDGRAFFTYVRNLELIDTWEDVDARERSKERSATSEVGIWASFVRPLRGDTVTLIDQNGLEVTGTAFWIGPDKKAAQALRSVAWRIGVRETPNANPHWGSGRDVVRIGGQKTPQGEARDSLV